MILTGRWSVHVGQVAISVGGGAEGRGHDVFMLTRRSLLKGITALGLTGAGLGAYAFGIEPRYMLSVTRYRLTPKDWPKGLHVRLAVLADIHAGVPYMSVDRIAEIVDRTNTLGADAILLLGDYSSRHMWVRRVIGPREFAGSVAGLKAPLGVHAVLGNHDWWDDPEAQRLKRGPPLVRRELERVGIPVYENEVKRLSKDGHGFWLAGLGDQIAIRLGRVGRRYQFRGVDDLPGTLARITDRAPIVLMAHEPDIFPDVPSRVALTVSGHTHGGQVRLAGYSPVVPSMYGNRYAYGHIVEEERNLIVSGGLGCSKLPVRFGVPPEIVVIDLGDAASSEPSRSTINPA